MAIGGRALHSAGREPARSIQVAPFLSGYWVMLQMAWPLGVAAMGALWKRAQSRRQPPEQPLSKSADLRSVGLV